MVGAILGEALAQGVSQDCTHLLNHGNFSICSIDVSGIFVSDLIHSQGRLERLGDASAKGRGRHDLYVGAESEDLHDQLSVVRVRDFQYVAAVALYARSLIWMPEL